MDDNDDGKEAKEEEGGDEGRKIEKKIGEGNGIE